MRDLFTREPKLVSFLDSCDVRDPAFKVEETLPDSVWGCSQRVCDRNTVKILFGGLRPATNEDHSGKV